MESCSNPDGILLLKENPSGMRLLLIFPSSMRRLLMKENTRCPYRQATRTGHYNPGPRARVNPHCPTHKATTLLTTVTVPALLPSHYLTLVAGSFRGTRCLAMKDTRGMWCLHNIMK